MEEELLQVLEEVKKGSISPKKARRKLLGLFSVSGSAVCPYCNGDGWTAEHDSHPHPDGDCMGMCPIQVQCPHCEATGRVTQEVLDKYNDNVKVSEQSDLPF